MRLLVSYPILTPKGYWTVWISTLYVSKKKRRGEEQFLRSRKDREKWEGEREWQANRLCILLWKRETQVPRSPVCRAWLYDYSSIVNENRPISNTLRFFQACIAECKLKRNSNKTKSLQSCLLASLTTKLFCHKALTSI